MKETELRDHPRCDKCGLLWGRTGTPIFYRLQAESHLINLPAVARQTGLAMVVGNARIAQAMGPNEDMTTKLESVTMYLCVNCVFGVTVGYALDRATAALAAPAPAAAPALPTPSAAPAALRSPDSTACGGTGATV